MRLSRSLLYLVSLAAYSAFGFVIYPQHSTYGGHALIVQISRATFYFSQLGSYFFG